MNLEQQRALALAKARRRRAEAEGQASAGQAQQQGNSGLLDAVKYGFETAGRQIGEVTKDIGDKTGIQTLSDWGDSTAKDYTQRISDLNYQRPAEADGIVSNLRHGNFRRAGESLVYGAAESAPSVGAGAAATVGAIAGGPVGWGAAGLATLANGGLTLGQIKDEKKAQGLNSDLNAKDFLTAAGSGAVELLPVGRGAGAALKFTREGVQQAAQEGLVVGDVASQGGQYSAGDVANRLADAGIVGGVMSKGMDLAGRGTMKVAKSPKAVADKIRYDNKEYSNSDRAAAQRLLDAADGNTKVLANVNDTGEGTAKGAANAALRQVRAESGQIVTSLRKLAKARGDRDAQASLDTVAKTMSSQVTPTPGSFLDTLDFHFPNEPDVARLRSLHEQMNTIQDFTTKGTNDLGGLSGSLTRRIDVFDKRNSLKLMGYAALVHSPVKALATIAGGHLVNKAAKGLDVLTNRRSRVKRFVDSVLRDGQGPQKILDHTADDTLKQVITMQKAQKASRDFMAQRRMEMSKEAAGLQKGSPLDQSKAETQATKANDWLRKLDAQNTAEMFKSGVVPDNGRTFETYRKFKHYTGISDPNHISDIMEQLGREGVIPPETAQHFNENPEWFAKNKELTYRIQEAVRQRGNPDYVAGPEPKANGANPDVARAKYNLTLRPVGDRRKFKAMQGEADSLALKSNIEANQAGLSADQYSALHALRSEMDSPAITRNDRIKMAKNIIPHIFPNNPAMAEHWIKQFTPLAMAGNEVAIFRDESHAAQADQAQQKDFEQRVAKAKKWRTKASEPPAKEAANLPNAPERQTRQPKTTADKALDKLNAPKQIEDQTASDAEQARDSEEVTVQPKGRGNKRSLEDRMAARVEDLDTAKQIADKYAQALSDHIDNLPNNVEGRVEKLIYDFASDRTTVNQLADAFASRFDIPPAEAARTVFDTLKKMEAYGKLQIVKPRGSDLLKFDGKNQRDAQGNPLHVLQLKFRGHGLEDNVVIAKAVNQVSKMVDQSGPAVEFDPGHLKDGAFEAFKDIPPERVDGTFHPILNFLNRLRNNRYGVSKTMMDQIISAMGGTSNKHKGTILDEMTPKTGDGRRRDEAPLRTVAQLFKQLEDRGDNTIRQEWMAGANLRVYSRNGLAHTQAGDLMKGLLRLPEKHPVGGPDGLRKVFHGIGNLLGFDKESINTRVNSVFDYNMVDPLLKFAEDPFGATRLKTAKGEKTDVGKIVKNSEGFFQALNAAHELKSMVDFAKERHPELAKKVDNRRVDYTAADLLSDQKVQGDLAQNYKTDFFVQLDASNNAYQIAGMLAGDPSIVRATGLLPPEGDTTYPDMRKGADIYMEPAKAVAERVPELKALHLPDQKLRKLFKKPIGTYLYDAAFNSRRDAFESELTKMADGVPIFGINGDGLVPIPQHVVDAMQTKDGAILTSDKYDVNGDVKKTVNKAVRIAAKGGRFYLESAEGNGKFSSGAKSFPTKEDAIRYAYGQDFYSRMGQELIREMNTRYPGVNSFLKFFGTVSKITKDSGKETVNVPTKDGMMLEYSFKQKPKFDGANVQTADGKVVRIGVRSPEYDLAGRGLAAFVTHSHDAYVLREVAKRMPELKGFNPIHDSFGFHPSDAPKGQEVWAKVMQELGDPNYNIFLNLLEANGISIEDFVKAGGDKGFLLGRRGIEPVDPKQIPTALS